MFREVLSDKEEGRERAMQISGGRVTQVEGMASAKAGFRVLTETARRPV